MLHFSEPNDKLKKLIKNAARGIQRWLEPLRNKRGKPIGGRRKAYSIGLRAGHTCPGANECQAFAIMTKAGAMKVRDGKHTKFRCYDATGSGRFKHTYLRQLNNEKQLKRCKDEFEMADLICESLPGDAGIVRIHTGGDFFSLIYMKAWMIVACRRPDVLFYGYTKSVNYYRDVEHLVDTTNFRLTMSVGGKYDHLIGDLVASTVAFSQDVVDALGIPVDDDDSHAALREGSFALMLHGTQPAGSEAAVALQRLKNLKKEAV